MTTLATLKAEIADDLARDDLTASIATEISAAIRYYQGVPFWFTETRDLTFTTVAGQAAYGDGDDSDIPLFYRLDGVFLLEDNVTIKMREFSGVEWQDLQDVAGRSRPYMFARYDSQMLLYPTPDTAYTVRMMGHRKVAEPATDSETGNPWMVHGFELIRSRAVKTLFGKKLQDYEAAAVWQVSENDQLDVLTRESNRRKATGFIKATAF